MAFLKEAWSLLGPPGVATGPEAAALASLGEHMVRHGRDWGSEEVSVSLCVSQQQLVPGKCPRTPSSQVGAAQCESEGGTPAIQADPPALPKVGFAHSSRHACDIGLRTAARR